MARHARAREIPPGQIKSILLSSDYVPSAIVRELHRLWDCPVYNHYGTTEMGFGGGVECNALEGCHLREADLYFEIVDPATGEPQPNGIPGEIVFTTLTRTGMPLIRYATGDLAAWIPDPCPCGTVLRRMAKVRGRIREMVRLRTGDWLGITDLDEALFPLPQIVNYSAALIAGENTDHLEIVIYPGSEGENVDKEAVEKSLLAVPPIASAISEGCLRLAPLDFISTNWVTTGVAKRRISQVSANGRDSA
jgi:phenylacetate-coenzyme A ligase PaaK-like adenylate-forming protein